MLIEACVALGPKNNH